jgi:cytochrome b
MRPFYVWLTHTLELLAVSYCANNTMENRSTTASTPNDERRVFVWDIFVRLFHWTLLVLMVAMVVTGKFIEDAIELHASLGQAVIVLVLFRLMWGVTGSSYARFSQFVRGPVAVISYARSLIVHQSGFMVGHNPLGGYMVVVLLLAVLLQSILGLFANDDLLFEGQFAYMVSKGVSDLITGLHQDLFYLLLVLVGLHVAAVIWHKLFMGEDLLKAMFTGYKELPSGVQAEDAQGGGVMRGLILLAISVAVVYGLVGLFG